MPRTIYFSYLSRFLNASFLVAVLLTNSYSSFAEEPTKAVITQARGTKLLIIRPDQKKGELVTPYKSELRRRLDMLFVPGDSESKAGLNFKIGEQQVWGGMLVETIPRNSNSEYTFPCRGRGSMTIAWAKAGKKGGQWRACNEGVYIKVPKGKPSQNKHAQVITEQASSKALISQGTNLDELLIQPGQDHTVIQVLSTDNGTDVFVLLGGINITPPTGSNLNLQTGQKYSYPNQQIAPFDRNPIVQSEDFKKFVNPDSWSSSSPASQALQNDLEEKQVALGIKSPPPPPLSPTAQEILDAHNQCRARVGVPPLKWSSQIASKAQDWADQLSKTGEFKHRGGGGSGFGENIVAGSMSPTELVNKWCDEQRNYDSQSGQCKGGTCGHFTQVVWRQTTELGCGLASHPRYGKVLVCNYDPPGNYRGERPY